MTDRPRIVMPLMHNIGGLDTCIGEVVVEDDTITWRFRGSYGDSVLDTVRADLMKVAISGGAQIFDLGVPFRPKQ